MKKIAGTLEAPRTEKFWEPLLQDVNFGACISVQCRESERERAGGRGDWRV